MSREVRKVPADWQHPKYTEENEPRSGMLGRLKPLLEGYADAAKEFMEIAVRDGLQAAIEYYGPAPNKNDYMPDWPKVQRTHYQMYETCSEGTPISPVIASPEELAHWLADNGASAFGGMSATYEQWLEVARGGWAPSAVISNGMLESGVAALANMKKDRG